MNLKDWEEFWAYLVGDYSIMEGMGVNHLDSVGEFLEWQRQEWIKHHDELDYGPMMRAGENVIRALRNTAETEMEQ